MSAVEFIQDVLDRAEYHDEMEAIRSAATTSQFSRLVESASDMPLPSRRRFIRHAAACAGKEGGELSGETSGGLTCLSDEVEKAINLMEGYRAIEESGFLHGVAMRCIAQLLTGADYHIATDAIHEAETGNKGDFLDRLFDITQGASGVSLHDEERCLFDPVETYVEVISKRCHPSAKKAFEKDIKNVPREHLLSLLHDAAEAAAELPSYRSGCQFTVEMERSWQALARNLARFGERARGIEAIDKSELMQCFSAEQRSDFEQGYYRMRYDDMSLLVRLARNDDDRYKFERMVKAVLAGSDATSVETRRKTIAISRDKVNRITSDLRNQIKNYAVSIGRGRDFEDGIKSIPPDRLLGFLIPAGTAARERRDDRFRRKLNTLVLWERGLEDIKVTVSMGNCQLNMMSKYYYRMNHRMVLSLVRSAESGQIDFNDTLTRLCRKVEMLEAGMSSIYYYGGNDTFRCFRRSAEHVPTGRLRRLVHPLAESARCRDDGLLRSEMKVFRTWAEGLGLIKGTGLLSEEDEAFLGRHYYDMPLKDVLELAEGANDGGSDFVGAFRRARENTLRIVAETKRKFTATNIRWLANIYRMRKRAVGELADLDRMHDLVGERAITDSTRRFERIFRTFRYECSRKTSYEMFARRAFHDATRCLIKSGFATGAIDGLPLDVLYGSIRGYVLEYLEALDNEEQRCMYRALAGAHNDCCYSECAAASFGIDPVTIYVVQDRPGDSGISASAPQDTVVIHVSGADAIPQAADKLRLASKGNWSRAEYGAAVAFRCVNEHPLT